MFVNFQTNICSHTCAMHEETTADLSLYRMHASSSIFKLKDFSTQCGHPWIKQFMHRYIPIPQLSSDDPLKKALPVEMDGPCPSP